MPTIVNKLIGTLKLGDTATGVAMEAQVSQIGTPQTVTRDAAVTVLTGDVIQAGATYSWALTGQALLDLSDPDGVFYFVNANQGQQLPFSFLPIGAAGPTIAGTVIVDGWDTEELAAGAIVQSKFTWPMQGPAVDNPAGRPRGRAPADGRPHGGRGQRAGLHRRPRGHAQADRGAERGPHRGRPGAGLRRPGRRRPASRAAWPVRTGWSRLAANPSGSPPTPRTRRRSTGAGPATTYAANRGSWPPGSATRNPMAKAAAAVQAGIDKAASKT